MADELLLDGALPPAANPELFGHKAQEDYLASSYKSGKGHHAILLEGAAGIGKATLAFRFANHVLHFPKSEKAPDSLIVPDHTSPVTRQIMAGASHDLLHLQRPVDAKTGKLKTAITVEEVRRAGHFLAQTSGTGNWRIVIVDAADDLNRNAANAILKILEEPPRNAMFLLIIARPGQAFANDTLALHAVAFAAAWRGRPFGGIGRAWRRWQWRRGGASGSAGRRQRGGSN